MAFSLEQAFEYLSEANAQGRLAHSFLFSGPEGSGKRRLVAEFFRTVNGNLTDAADFHGIEPESKSRKILVEQIRELEASLRMHATRAKVKFGVVYEADRLMPQAANAFLKTLEEPPDHSVLILVTALPEALLDTIRSRCIEVSLRAPGAKSTDRRGSRVGGRTLSDCRGRRIFRRHGPEIFPCLSRDSGKSAGKNRNGAPRPADQGSNGLQADHGRPLAGRA